MILSCRPKMIRSGLSISAGSDCGHRRAKPLLLEAGALPQLPGCPTMARVLQHHKAPLASCFRVRRPTASHFLGTNHGPAPTPVPQRVPVWTYGERPAFHSARAVVITSWSTRSRSVKSLSLYFLIACSAVLTFGQTPSVGEVSFRALVNKY
jgi:hypothetical protein